MEIPDIGADCHKDELERQLRETRVDRYNHITDARFDSLVSFVRAHSRAFWVEGAPPSYVEGFVFDIELVPGARPHRARQPALGPAQANQEEDHHRAKYEARGRLARPAAAGEWATNTNIAWKKDSEWGRWVMDRILTALRSRSRAAPST